MATPETLTMYDPATGAPVVVAANQAGELFRSGKATFAADQDVPIKGADGRIEVLKGSEAGTFFQSRESYLSSGVASQQALRQQQAQDEFGGVGGTVAAAGLGALRGATVGLSDAALAETGLLERRTLAGLQEANPVASTGGEVAGLLAPLLVSGGGSAVASGGQVASRGLLRRGAAAALETVTAPSRAVMGLGRGVEAGATALLGEGAAARVAAAGAGAAVEGALFGVGQAVSEAEIRDVPLTAERIMAATGHGALLGGATGAGASLLGALLRGGVSKAGELGQGLLERVGSREAQVAGELGASVTPKAERTLTSLVDDFGREQAMKASGATSGMIERLQKAGPEQVTRAIKQLLDDVPEAIGKKAGSILNPGEKALGAERLLETRGARVGELVDQLAASGQKVEIAKVVSAQREQITQDMIRAVSPDAQRAARQADEWLTSLEKKVGDGDVKLTWEARRELRKDIDWKKGPEAGDRYNEWKKDLYRSLGDEIEATGARAGGDLGPEFSTLWKNANADYRAAAWLREATAKGAASDSKNRFFGLSEQFGILAGVAQGGLAAAPMALAGGVVQHLVRRYGSDVAANVARSATRGEALVAIDQAVERLAGERVGALVRGGRRVLQEAPAALPGVGLAVEKAVRQEQPAERRQGGLVVQFRAARDELRDGVANREARLATTTAGLEEVNPQLGAAVRAVAVRASDFLASKMPTVPQRASLQPHLERERMPPAHEMERYLRYERAVSDPLSVLEDAQKGRLRKEGVEALQAVYPTLYQGLRSQVTAALAERGSRLSYPERVQFGLLLDLPADPSMELAAIRAYQQIQHRAPSPFAATAKAAQAQGPGPGLRGPLRLPSLATPGDRAA